MPREQAAAPASPGVDLLWIPVGAGAHVVRLSGRAFERCSATSARRAPVPLFHSALVVEVARRA